MFFSFKGALLLEPGLNNGERDSAINEYSPDEMVSEMHDRCIQHRWSSRYPPRLHWSRRTEVDIHWWQCESLWRQVFGYSRGQHRGRH